MVEIQCPEHVLSGALLSVRRKRGVVLGNRHRRGTPLHIVTAHLPVAESFGFVVYLRENTNGESLAMCMFHHWSTIKADPHEDEATAQLVSAIRRRKGLSESQPSMRDLEGAEDGV
mmetsp:Transcript_9128/g.19843  ORF Transcript_9128/g.19843 Transcript_9128/m.19843 type:complete len:116 (-) Transcript_9128:178-525(-)